MAGTVTITADRPGPVQEVVFAWTSDSSGNATATTTDVYSGELVRVLCVPGGTTPSNLYDVTLTDDNSIDLLYGGGADCSNASNRVLENVGVVSNSTLSISVSNAGSAKTGTVIVQMR